MAVVTFLSDFGTRDGFVAAMKGVVVAGAPGATLVDAAHDIEPGDIEAAAFVLGQYWSLFPPGTIHLAVVDPGVGSARKPLIVVADQRRVVAPDNGLISRVVAAAEDWRCYEVTANRYLPPNPSATFHGRDIFAPVAARLAAGVTPEELGRGFAQPLLLKLEPPIREKSRLRGRIAHVDRFGNLISDIPAGWLDVPWRFRVGERDVGPVRRTYSDAAVGEPVVVVGSLGTVEIAVRGGSAAEGIGAGRGAEVVAVV